jgi:hypothetical protein
MSREFYDNVTNKSLSEELNTARSEKAL